MRPKGRKSVQSYERDGGGELSKEKEVDSNSDSGDTSKRTETNVVGFLKHEGVVTKV